MTTITMNGKTVSLGDIPSELLNDKDFCSQFDTATLDLLKQSVQIRDMASQTEQHILRHYPQTKQASDTADKMYFETALRASGAYPSLDADIAKAVADYYTAQTSGAPVTTADLAAQLAVGAGDEVGLEQLIKVGIRIKWVQDCKAAYHAAVADLQAGNSPVLNLPDYPL